MNPMLQRLMEKVTRLTRGGIACGSRRHGLVCNGFFLIAATVGR
jgi:hypothetical protein